MEPIVPRFRWTCSYLNCVWFDVTDHTGMYEVELRYRVCDYEKSIRNRNYTEESWEREVVGAIGLLRRSHYGDQPIPQSTVDAFNAWRKEQHEQFCAQIRAQPDRYGANAVEEMIASGLIRVPPVVRGAHMHRRSRDWREGIDWIVNGEEPQPEVLWLITPLDQELVCISCAHRFGLKGTPITKAKWNDNCDRCGAPVGKPEAA